MNSDSDSHSRRNFLRPRSIGKLLSTVTGGEWERSVRTEKADAGMLCRIGVDAMATRFEVLFEAIDLEYAPTVEKELERILELESQMTVYREESEVSQINRNAFHRDVVVEENLFHLFELGHDLWKRTDGAFDITVHELLKLWGIYQGPTRLPEPDEIRHALLGCGFGRVRLDPRRRTVRFLHPRTGFNLAAIGKGYALDCVARSLTDQGMEHFLLHGGQSSLRSRGATTWEEGWLVDLRHPLDYSHSIAKILLKNRSMSTSVRIPERLREGPVSGHILDPRTGRPIDGPLLSASVIATSAADAEALSTALLVMGLDKALEYCENHPRLGVILTLEKEGSDDLEIRLAGAAEDCVEVLS